MTDMVFFLPVLSCPSFKLCVRNQPYLDYYYVREEVFRWSMGRRAQAMTSELRKIIFTLALPLQLQIGATFFPAL